MNAILALVKKGVDKNTPWLAASHRRGCSSCLLERQFKVWRARIFLYSGTDDIGTNVTRV
ncbi:hypothetical protein I7I53_00708 [Histoplasma capsulatum var. duboisii H88]|uniref:Uncharacterized protein n=1 Tax=Ajellomyces capsulatus (strain H88) TaxID=544711 RepID=A0A8A1LLC5_AJEC8|nr:hypothetical protein I7I53_00708 [Histoplasma capsulatum var. duboisii H88]